MNHECLLLFSGQELEATRDRVQKQVRTSIVQIRPSQEIRADHLQAITTGFIAPKHESRGLERLLDDRDLALVQLEVDDLPGLRLAAGQFLFDLPFELFLAVVRLFVTSTKAPDAIVVPRTSW
jgi:hypothetical protein